MVRPGSCLAVGLLLALLGCAAPHEPRGRTQGPTATLMFDRLVPASTVGDLLAARSGVRLDRLRFHVGGSTGSHSFRDLPGASAPAKIDSFRARLRRRTRRRTRIGPRRRRVREHLGGVSLTAFAGSLDAQQLALSIVQLHREQEALLDRLASDGPLVYAVSITGDADRIEGLLSAPNVAGIVPERRRFGWLRLALRNPFSLALSRPEAVRERSARRAARTRRAFDRLEAVSVSDPSAVPESIAQLYRRARAVARADYDVPLGDR
jgi:hypothetical protein